jgi:Uma2 family endonuclease
MSEDLQVQDGVRVATNGAGPHPGDMGDTPRPEDVYEALERLPEGVTGQIIDGELYVSPQPRTVHNRAAGELFRELVPFGREEGPGGWLHLLEPELHLKRDVLVPDIAGWRRERMPEMPDIVGVKLPPDWVCEVLSPSTEALDRGRKMAVYAREEVGHLWFVDPRSQSLEVFRLEGKGWKQLGVYTGNAVVRAEPFEALSLNLAFLWKR